jgi:protein TonB
LPPGQVSVSASEQQARLVKQVPAVYPELAGRAHISGSVNFNVLIAKDGTMRNIRVVSGHPMLVAAALDAVKQWVYEPLLVNGSPVEVVTTVTVNFAPQ